MSETEGKSRKEILKELDSDARELLTLIHLIKIDMMVDADPSEKIKKATRLALGICSKLYQLGEEN